MRKSTSFLMIALFVACTAVAQIPMYFNTNSAGGGNVFPLGNTGTSRKVQWFIPPNSLGTVPPGNNITVVYFQAGSSGTNTYPIINVKLKTGAGTGLTGTASGPIEPGMTLVYTAVNQVITATAGGWISFTLTTPWLYNPNLPLIVELEHNSTTCSQQIYQAVSIPGPGNGRQWADYNVGTITGVGTQQINFGIDVLPATPCTTAPPANTIVPVSFSTCPGLINPNLTLASTYSFGGITYQWQSSTISPVGPFTSIPGATMSSAPVPTLGTTTWFQAVATCTNTGGTTTLNPSQYFVTGSVTSTVPYYESFENIQINNRLPNCSWYAANLGTSVNTYTTSQSNNRIARTGTKFGSFTQPSNNNIVYSNGITMSPGITYSAAIWYTTEYYGYNNWTSLSLMIGSSQNPGSLLPIAVVSPAVSGPYTALSGVFTVPSAGDYYIAIKATSSSGNAIYLSFDDLSVIVPCSGDGAVNSPTLNLTANNTTICTGDVVNLNVSGANTYSWSNGATGASTSDSPLSTTNYTVWGTNALTGCTSTITQLVNVLQSPQVLVFVSSPTVCSGKQVVFTALGASSYVWSNGGNGSIISITPTVGTTSSVVNLNVIGTGPNGCSASGSQGITVLPLPGVTPSSSNAGDACKGDLITLSANSGLVTYQWLATSGMVLQGNPISISTLPVGVTNFTITGTNASGCSGKNTIAQSVSECTDIKNFQNVSGKMKIYPNPTSGEFAVESSTNSLKTIEVIDITGRVILTNKNTDQKVFINLSEFASGVYYLKISSQDGTEVQKIVKR